MTPRWTSRSPGARQKAKGKRQKAEGRRQKAETAFAASSVKSRICKPDGLRWRSPSDCARNMRGIAVAVQAAVAKPFDIRERAFLFGCDVVRAFPTERPLEPPAWRIWSQAVSAATSVSAHLEEADAASSRTHFVSLNRGALREAREARYWLRLIAETKLRNHERVRQDPDHDRQARIQETSGGGLKHRWFCLVPSAFRFAFCLLPFALTLITPIRCGRSAPAP